VTCVAIRDEEITSGAGPLKALHLSHHLADQSACA
jgi:hypothetical protein